jgi:hypothetical protein
MQRKLLRAAWMMIIFQKDGFLEANIVLILQSLSITHLLLISAAFLLTVCEAQISQSCVGSACGQNSVAAGAGIQICASSASKIILTGDYICYSSPD